MPRRQSSTPLEQAVLVRHLVPWWLYLLLAAFCWLGLRAIAQWALPSSRIGDGSATLLHSFALVGQVLLPLALLCAGVADLFNRVSWRRRLDRLRQERAADSLLEQLSWQEMRDLIELTLETEGYEPVIGPISGSDLLLQRQEQKVLLVTEHWRDPVLEPAQLERAVERADLVDAEGVILVCGGRIGASARAAARRRGIRLIDRGLMLQWLAQSESAAARQPD